MPIPNYVYLTDKLEDSSRSVSMGDFAASFPRGSTRSNDSLSSLNSSWSRWDDSEAGICTRRKQGDPNYQSKVPSNTNPCINHATDLIRREVIEANTSIQAPLRSQNQKLQVPVRSLTVAKPPAGNRRSRRQKLTYSPPQLPRRAIWKTSAPPKAPLRQLSMAQPES